MEFFSPQNVFKGQVSIEGAIDSANHAITKQYLEANAVVGIAADSANYVEFVTVNGQKQLKVKPLTITDVAVDTVATSIGGWVSANYVNGNEKQEGDIIVLTAVAGRAQTFIHNGGTNGDENDFTEIEGADVTDAEIRGALSASNGVQYNSANGQFQANVGEIRGFFAAGSGLSYDATNGTFELSVDTDGISEGTTNLYYTDARAQSAISVTGAGLSYTSGAIQLTAKTDDIPEGLTNLYYEDQRVWDSLGVANVAGPDKQMLQYDSAMGLFNLQLSNIFAEFSAGTGLTFSGGEFSLNADTSMVSEDPSALYFTDARAQAAITVGSGLQKVGGHITLTADTDAIPEGATNLYYEDQRVWDSLGVSSEPGELLQFDSSKGEYSLLVSKFRKQFAPQSLTANTWATLNHGLGIKIVHVSAYDSTGMLVQLDVQLVDQDNVKVKSVANMSNLEIVVSI